MSSNQESSCRIANTGNCDWTGGAASSPWPGIRSTPYPIAPGWLVWSDHSWSQYAPPRRRGVISSCLSLPLAVRAQTCHGAASLSARLGRINAGLNVSENAEELWDTDRARCADQVVCVCHSIRAEYDNVVNAGIVVGPPAATRLISCLRLQFCPLARFGYQSGPTLKLPKERFRYRHTQSVSAGHSAAIAFAPNFDFVPFVAAPYIIQQASASISGNVDLKLNELHGDRRWAGFVVNKMLMLQPAVSTPLRRTGGKTTFQLGFAFNFDASSAQP